MINIKKPKKGAKRKKIGKKIPKKNSKKIFTFG